jgi:hypothetical protein
MTSLYSLLYVMLIGLKITGYLSASWWIVLLWPVLVVLVFIVIQAFFLALVAKLS